MRKPCSKKHETIGKQSSSSWANLRTARYLQPNISIQTMGNTQKTARDCESSLPLVTDGVRRPLVHLDGLRVGLEQVLPPERDEPAAPRRQVRARVDREEPAEAEQLRHGPAHPGLLPEPVTDPVVVERHQLLVVLVHHRVVRAHLLDRRLVLFPVVLGAK